jgi:cardiolipin synthase A/B
MSARQQRGRVWPPRRPSFLRLVFVLLGALLALQVSTIAVLSFVVASRRRLRRPLQGFPHLRTPEVAVSDNQLKIYSYGRELFDAMIAAIDSAKESIYLETFIWKGDAVGKEFKEHLARKAAEGVAVYVIFDSFGNLVVPRAFKQFPAAIHTLRYRAIARVWHIIDPRRYGLDHRKLLIVDGHIAFIGGYNIGQLYATEWRDTHLRIRGRTTADLAQSFVDFWNRNAPARERITRHYPRRFDPLISVRSNDAMRLTFPIRDMYIEAVDRAEYRIRLTNAYFVPDHVLLEALKAAAARGVDVQVLLPAASNHIVVDWAARGYFTDCLRAGIKIFGYRKAMIHAKTCTIDGSWSTIGTAKLDRLSSVGNYEVNLEIYSAEVAAQMEALFACDLQNAFEVTTEAWQARPWYAKMAERLVIPLRAFV